MEHKTFPAFTTKIEDDLGIVDAIVAVMGNVDDGDDIIHPGAFVKTILERGTKIRVLDQHQTDSIMRILGKPMEVREVGRDQLPVEVLAKYPDATGGLWTRTQYLLNTPEGKGAFIRIKENAVDEYSIGYDPIKGALDYSKGEDGRTIRNLRELKLYEYSPVLWAMNQATGTLSAKEKPAEAKPWDIFKRDGKWYVYKVDTDGKPTGDALGEHDSEEEARQQVEALYANEKDEKAVTRSEADGNHPASHYLVVEDPEKPSTWHLRVRDVNGDPDHRLMGAAWAALHGGYRGNVYEGPGKQEAIRKLRAMYTSEDMDTPDKDKAMHEDEDHIAGMQRVREMMQSMLDMMDEMMGGKEKQAKAGRRVRADKIELIHELESVLGKLKAWAEYADEEDEEDTPPKGAVETPEDNKQAGPGNPPTSEELLRLIELEEEELSLLR